MNGAFGLVLDKNQRKLLLVKRRDYPIWVMPGGGIEKYESPKEAVVREIFEESGFNVKVTKKIAVYLHSKNRKNHFYLCELMSGSATPSPESSQVEFFNLTNLPEPINPLISYHLRDYNLNSKVILKKEVPKMSYKIFLKGILKHPIIVIRYFFAKIGLRINT